MPPFGDGDGSAVLDSRHRGVAFVSVLLAGHPADRAFSVEGPSGGINAGRCRGLLGVGLRLLDGGNAAARASSLRPGRARA
jgi:hypothetical protein